MAGYPWAISSPWCAALVVMRNHDGHWRGDPSLRWARVALGRVAWVRIGGRRTSVSQAFQRRAPGGSGKSSSHFKGGGWRRLAKAKASF